MTARALTIAGSDVSGGAGLEADLKMFQEFGVFGTAVVTCIVTFDPETDFQHDIEFFDTELIDRQLTSALAVHRFDAIKSGMVGTADAALHLSKALADNALPYVMDPVLVCKGSGTMVDLKDLFLQNLVPLATVITPNLEETATLLGGGALDTEADLASAARELHALGAGTVVVKGGARLAGDEAIDILFDGTRLVRLSAPKVENALVNGAGCSFASSIAAGLARGADVISATTRAKEAVAHAIARRLPNATGVPSTLHPAIRTEPAEGIEIRLSEL